MHNTALLVIDVQQGAFDGVVCPPIDHASALLAACNSLLSAARSNLMPVIFIQHCEPDGVFVQDTPQHAVAQALHQQGGEICVLKHASSAFENTTLDVTLKQLKVSQLVICGLQSEHCVFNTTVAALDLGYAVTLAEDGHHTWTTKDESAAAISSRINVALNAKGAVLRTVPQIVLTIDGE
jgi:nicotinamidase-related amidase